MEEEEECREGRHRKRSTVREECNAESGEYWSLHCSRIWSMNLMRLDLLIVRSHTPLLSQHGSVNALYPTYQLRMDCSGVQHMSALLSSGTLQSPHWDCSRFKWLTVDDTAPCDCYMVIAQRSGCASSAPKVRVSRE
jgi:hypothetical protein